MAHLSSTGTFTGSHLGNGSGLTNISYSNITGLPSTFPADMTNIYSKTESDNRYLRLTGGILTGNLDIEKASPVISIKSQTEGQSSIFYLSTPFNYTSALKTAIISEGLSSWGRSRLHFCLNDNQTDNSPSQNASVAHARMTILPSGNVGIGITNPFAPLCIGTPSLTSDGALVISV